MKFQAVAWESHDLEEEKRFVVRAYGRSADGQSVAASTFFEPYFFIKLGSRTVPDVRGAKVQYVSAKDLWGFQNGAQSRFAKLTFRTHREFRSASYVLERDNWPVYEANLDPILRFMHVSGCTSTGWIDVQDAEEDPDTTCDVNLRGVLVPVDHEGLAPLKIMSFDIECHSSTGAFPDPKNPEDAVFQIGMTIKEFGRGQAPERKCLCFKKTSGPDVESFETERDLLRAFGAFLRKTDPDIITGWNIFGFDLEFLFVRALRHGVEPLWGRRTAVPSELVVKHLSSSALGSNELRMVPMVGRYVFDLFQDVKREHKLESYSLNNVSRHFLKSQKFDMPVKEIFRRFSEGDPDRLGEVAAYCLQDTALPLQLMDKLCQIQNQVEMAKACWVPLSFLSERGQQIKVFSQMAKKARELGFLIPTFRRGGGSGGEDGGYQGATVLEAQTGAYYGPITALDFASLYPSIMCAENLCYSTLVMDPKWGDVPGVEYKTFGPYKFAQSSQGKPVVSLLPTILTDLKAYRKKAKKLMAASEGTPMEAIYNGQQLAYKISMNSIYGFTGASKGMLPCVAIASTVTMRGRQMIEETKNYVEANFPGAKVRYGDSVTADTAVLIKVDGLVYVKPIAGLVEEDEWIDYPGFLKEGDSKEQCDLHGVETWTHLGWKPIRRVIRHKCEKNIWRVASRTGIVDVTEDHSLLDKSLGLVKPGDVQVGTELFHSFPDIFQLGPPPSGFQKSLDIFSSQESAMSASPRGYFRTFRQDIAQYYHIRLKILGFNVTFSAQGSAYQVNFTTKSKARTPSKVVKITPNLKHEFQGGVVLGDGVYFCTDRVYDLETEAGTFQAGVGCMIVKNTDSVMVEFDVQGRKGQEAIDYSWAQGELAAEACTKLFRAPNSLELEKVYCPYFLYSKKRYAAKMFEKKGDAVVFKKIDVKGLQVVRRDSCPYVRETLKELLGQMLESSDPRPVIHRARQAAEDLVTGRVPVEKLLMSKQLGTGYKSDALPHVAVRDKMRARAPGSEPQQGDRVPFLVIQGPGKLFEKVEDPVWVRDNNVPLDYQYYFTNQFKKPVLDLLEPLVGSGSEQVIFGAATAGSKKGTYDPKMRTLDAYFKKQDAS